MNQSGIPFTREAREAIFEAARLSHLIEVRRVDEPCMRRCVELLRKYAALLEEQAEI